MDVSIEGGVDDRGFEEIDASKLKKNIDIPQIGQLLLLVGCFDD
jgi:hypothetical protein